MTTETEMRRMLLDFALEQARKVCSTVDDSDLDFGRIMETLNVAGTEWHICARYWTDEELVRIEGHPHKDAPDDVPELAGLPPQLAALFGQAVQQDDPDGTFAFALPRAWLPDRKES